MTAKPRAPTPRRDPRAHVRSRYAAIAQSGGCCGPSAATGCGPTSACCGDSANARELGYTPEEIAALPDGANHGLGCGNPTALLSLAPGESVLDLGSGAGIDCFLAARRVGPKGAVIGVDMTPEMVAKARANAARGRYRNVEFRLGEIEHLPVADASVDVVISNCVINLAPEKGPVYREAFRVLRPGGRVAISDVVATRPISAADRADPELWSSCSSGALDARTIRSLLRKAGFARIRVDVHAPDAVVSSLQGPAALGVYSANIRAVKPTR